MFDLVPFILLFPVLGLLTNLIFGRYLGERLVGIIASGAAAAAFIVSVIQVFALVNNNFHVETVLIADWITIGKLYLPWQIRVDTLSVTMMVLVTGVGTLIHIYAVGYMHGDKRFARFFVYLNLFVVMMLVLVAADNYLYKYDKNNYSLISSQYVEGIRNVILWNDKIIVTRGDYDNVTFMPILFDSYLQIFNTSDLSFHMEIDTSVGPKWATQNMIIDNKDDICHL